MLKKKKNVVPLFPRYFIPDMYQDLIVEITQLCFFSLQNIDFSIKQKSYKNLKFDISGYVDG